MKLYSDSDLAEAIASQGRISDHWLRTRKDEWRSIEAVVGETILDCLSEIDAEFLRLIYGIERPQLLIQNATRLIYNRWYPEPRWAESLIGKALIRMGASDPPQTSAAAMKKNDNSENSELLAPRAAAQFLGITPRTLKDWRLKGTGPRFHRLSDRTVRYRRSDLEAFITDARVEQPFGASDG